MDLGLRGRAYVVTGGSRGLGRASAEHLVADGADVLIASRSQESVQATAEELSGRGPGRAVGIAVDLGDPASAEQLLAAAQEHFGRLDGLVLSVGGPPGGSVAAISDEQWRDAFESVFLGPVRLARTALAQAQEPLAITLVLSTSVRSPIAGLAVSNGLRPGLAMTAKTLADEYGPAGHRVNAILPGRITTDRLAELESAAQDPDAMRQSMVEAIPLRRYGAPSEFGAVVAFITSPAASYVSGSVVTVDGGATRTI